MVNPPVPPMAPANAVLFASPAVSVLLPRVTLVPVTPANEPTVSLAVSVKSAPEVSRITAPVSAMALPPDKAKVPAFTVVLPVYVLVPDSVSVPAPTLVKPPVPPIAPAKVVWFASPAVSVLLPRLTLVPVTPAKEPTVSLALSVKFTPNVSRITAPVLAMALPPAKAKVPALTVVLPVKVLVPDNVSVPAPTLVKPPVPPIAPANVVLFASPAVKVLLLRVTVVPDKPAKEPTVSSALSAKVAPDVPKTTAPVLAMALPPDKASMPALTVVVPV